MSDYDEESDEQLQNPAEDTMKCVELNPSNDVNRSKKSRLEKLIVKLKEDIEAKNSTLKELLSEKKDLQSNPDRSIRSCDAFEERTIQMSGIGSSRRKSTPQRIPPKEDEADTFPHPNTNHEEFSFSPIDVAVTTFLPAFLEGLFSSERQESVPTPELETELQSEDEKEKYKRQNSNLAALVEDYGKIVLKLQNENNELKAENARLQEQAKLLEETRKRLRAGIPGFERMTTNEIISHNIVTPTHEQLTGFEDLGVEHFIKSLEISSEEKKQEFRDYIMRVLQKGYDRANVELMMEQILDKIDNQERQQNERNRNEAKENVEE
ncbi:hypothetical protein B9Z55_007345 [Caenorhabditis nigoni]|uniref:Uncharacterized protein n=1 Tax=Caenorhabditis nigoni TaxID=1611254 RepID=A0A2G5V965_9PELO|nr:hypothetical protein B9Z55_007345 [Caenorhabditis nigoni]